MTSIRMTAALTSASRAARRALVRPASCLRSLALLAGLLAAAGCNRGGDTEAGAADADKAPAAAPAAGGPAEGAAARADHGAEVVVLDTTAVRLGGIRVGAVETVTTSGLPVTGSITYDPNRVSHIGARAEGRVTAVRAELGARVSRGQVLATLESPEVGEIRVAQREALALVGIAEENFSRERRLAEQGISSRKELLLAEADLRRAEASARSAAERLRVLGAGRGSGSQFTVTAPFAGAVVARDASLGEMVTPADTLFTVADLSRVAIELDVFERDLARVREGQRVAVTVTAYPGRTFPGRIAYLAPVLDPERRTARARVEIPNPGGDLRPGMFARAAVQVGAEAGPRVVVVPQAAVQEVEGRRVVFVPGDRAGEFRPVAVEVGESLEGDRVAITGGLAPDARIVTAGAFALRSELAKGELAESEH